MLEYLLWGLGGALAFFLFKWVSFAVKASKDPEVKAASELRMSVAKYRQYKVWYDEHQRLMRVYGTDSKEADRYFGSFFNKISNKNEWRRYQEFRYQDMRNKFSKALKDLEE